MKYNLEKVVILIIIVNGLIELIIHVRLNRFIKKCF